MEKLKLKKEGQGLNIIVPSILVLSLGAIILIFTLVIMDEVWDQTDENTTAYDKGNETIVGMGKFGDYWDLIVLAVVITVVISLLLVVFSIRRVR